MEALGRQSYIFELHHELRLALLPVDREPDDGVLLGLGSIDNLYLLLHGHPSPDFRRRYATGDDNVCPQVLRLRGRINILEGSGESDSNSGDISN